LSHFHGGARFPILKHPTSSESTHASSSACLHFRWLFCLFSPWNCIASRSAFSVQDLFHFSFKPLSPFWLHFFFFPRPSFSQNVRIRMGWLVPSLWKFFFFSVTHIPFPFRFFYPFLSEIWTFFSFSSGELLSFSPAFRARSSSFTKTQILSLLLSAIISSKVFRALSISASAVQPPSNLVTLWIGDWISISSLLLLLFPTLQFLDSDPIFSYSPEKNKFYIWFPVVFPWWEKAHPQPSFINSGCFRVFHVSEMCCFSPLPTSMLSGSVSYPSKGCEFILP